MARARSRRIGRLPFILIAVVVIAVVIVFATSQTLLTSSTEFYNYYADQSIFGLTLVPNVNILCTIQSETEIVDVFGNRFLLSSRSPTIISTFTNFQVTGLVTTSSEISFLDPKAEVKCDPQVVDVSINLVGGWVQTRHEVQDQNGNFKQISSVVKQIPNISRSIKGMLTEIPTDTVTAQEIENTANLMGILSKNVQVRTTISTNLEITTTATGTLLNTGGQVISSAGYVKIIVDQPPPTTSLGRLVDITKVTPVSGYCFLGTTSTACGSSTQSQIDFTGGTMTMTVTGVLDNWTISEGLPFLRVFDPRGQNVGSDIVMTTTPRDLGNGQHEFKRINFDIARIINDNNISTNKGTWILEMHSNNDVRKSTTGQTVVDRKTFILQDLSPLVVPPDEDPTCQTGQIIVNGQCQDPMGTDPPSEPQCPTQAELTATAQSLNDGELILTLQLLPTITNSCQQLQFDIFQAEANSRGLDISQIETPEGTTKTIGKINFIANYEATSATSNEGCQDFGSIPEFGVEIQAFQLISSGGTCDGFRFGSAELRPIIDFGGTLSDSGILIDKSSVQLSHSLFMSKNNAFPESPEFECTTSGEQLPSCIVSNHNFDQDPTGIFLQSNEVINILEPTDAQTSGEYQLSLVTLTAGNLETKLRNAGVVLNQGDVYSYMLQVVGKFDSTVNGQAVIGVIPPMVISQDFTFNEFGGVQCDPETELFDQIVGCIPIPPPTCTPPQTFNVLTNSCEGGDLPPVMCPEVPICSAGTNLEFLDELDVCGNNVLECVVIESPPPPPVDGDLPDIIEPTPAGGCPPQYILNAFGNCQLIGSGSTGDNSDPKGDTSGGGFCELDADFNFSQCFASLFKAEGDAPSFTLTGTSGAIIGIVVLVTTIVIIIAVIVRIRRSRGFKF